MKEPGSRTGAEFKHGFVERVPFKNLSTAISPETTPLLITSVSGIDITTRVSPVVAKLRTIVQPQQVVEQQSVYATPLTTLAIEIAARSADLSVGFYPGNRDRFVSADEFIAALPIAEQTVKTVFGLGLLDGVGLFTSPPLFLATNDSDAERMTALYHRTAIEVFSALLYEMLGDRPNFEKNPTTDKFLVAIARDLVDGELDAAEFGMPITELPEQETFFAVLNQALSELEIPNSGDRVLTLRKHMENESHLTAPKLKIKSWRLDEPEIGNVVFLVDADGDGFADPKDVFPSDPAEWRDNDGDGVGDNGDLFPNDGKEWADRDGDGVGDNGDAFPDDPSEWDDIDEDAVGDNSDVFPRDPNEWMDSDGDGVGDNGDRFPSDPNESRDSDGDSVGDNADIHPFNDACSEASDGNAQDCFVTLLVRMDFDQVEIDEHGILYILFAQDRKVLRWDSETQHFLSSIELDPNSLGTRIAMANRHSRLYIGYDNGAITFVEPEVSLVENSFASLEQSVEGLTPAGIYLLAEGGVRHWERDYVFDQQGIQRGYKDHFSPSPIQAFSEADNRAYYYYHDAPPRNLYWEEIDPDTGRVRYGRSATNTQGFSSASPIIVRPDGGLVLLHNGDIYSSDLGWRGSLPLAVEAGAWTTGMGLVTLTSIDEDTELQRRDERFRLIDSAFYPGRPVAIFEVGDSLLLVLEEVTRWRLDVYVPNDDSDGDGIENSADAYPVDLAASQDSDRDRYPDAWNPGMDEFDSTEGLELDAFPLDSACHLPEQGRPDQPDVCDVARSIPEYVPDEIQVADDGVIYLLSTLHQRIFRWSAAEGAYLNPIVVGSYELVAPDGPTTMAYAENTSRLYLGYPTGEMTYLELDDLSAEIAFASLRAPVVTLVAAGPLLVSGTGRYRYSAQSFDAYGTLIQSWSDRNFEFHDWDKSTEKLYYSRDSFYDFFSVRFDPATGRRVEVRDTPYHGDFPIRSPIRVSLDGSRILLGSGDLYDGSTREILRSLRFTFVDAVWRYGNSFLTIQPGDSGWTELENRNPDLEVVDFQDFPGDPVRVVRAANRIIVVTQLAGRPQFNSYVPSIDRDGDGVANDADAFPQDPAASVDRDRDGFPDPWNSGKDEDDSTQDLALDAFPNDSACQLIEHGLPSAPDVCNIAGQIPSYEPSQILTDEMGTVYLLSPENDRIFRWTTDGDMHQNPLVVRADAREIAYSTPNRCVYIAYEDGEITQIDPDDQLLIEEDFTHTVGMPLALQAVGEFLFVIDPVKNVNSHNLINPSGETVSSMERSVKYRSDVTWSEAAGRIYFINRNGNGEPYWEGIEPAAGQFTDEGPRFNRLDYSSDPMIRVSHDGLDVLFGTGVVYDADLTTVRGRLPTSPDDALWLADASLVTIRESGDGRTMLEQWNPDLSNYNVQFYSGDPIRVVMAGDEIVVVTRIKDAPAFAIYTPTDDGDGDGVVNSEDALPLDPAASVDSDRDGFPDEWNPGRGPDDSTEGLTVDAFPNDSACQFAEQGLPLQPDICDIAGSIPAYSAKDIVADENGTLYLLSPENDSIFRWSIDGHAPLNPIFVNDDPRHLTYSETHSRLYFASSNRSIFQIDTTDPQFSIEPFTTAPDPVAGITSAGDFLFVIGKSFYSYPHHTFAADGAHIGRGLLHRYSPAVTFSPANDRVYVFRHFTSPNEIWYESIDRTTGTITEKGDSPYHGDYLMFGPIRVSGDGTRVLLGSGHIFQGISLEFIATIPVTPTDAMWLPDGSVATIRPGEADQTILEHWTADYAHYNTQLFAGEPIRVLMAADEIVVVTDIAGHPTFETYTPNEDGDGDGVPNRDDDFPIDPAASLDTDHDGYPDAWNPGMGARDSTQGLSIDAFPNDLACQLPEHGIGGICDFNPVLPLAADEDFCTEDMDIDSALSGELYLGKVSDFIPLCDGWVIFGDIDDNQVVIRNIVTGRDGAVFDVRTEPADLEIDLEAKILYVALPRISAVGVLNLISGDIRVVRFPTPIRAVQVDPGEGVFAVDQDYGRSSFYWLELGAIAPTGHWSGGDGVFRYNPVRDEFVQVTSRGFLYQYEFDPDLGLVPTGGYQLDDYARPHLAISPDGQHIAGPASYFSYSANSTFHYSPENLHLLGSWRVGLTSVAAAFDTTSQRVVVGNREDYFVFDVASHEKLADHDLGDCETGGRSFLSSVAFSRGGRIAFAMRACYSPSSSRVINWFVPETISE